MPNSIQNDIFNVGASDSGLSDIDLKAFKYKIGEREKIIIASERQVNDIIEKLEEERRKKSKEAQIKDLQELIKAEMSSLKDMEGEDKKLTQNDIKRNKKKLRDLQDFELKLKEETESRAFQIADTYNKNLYKSLDFEERKRFTEMRKRRAEEALENSKDIEAMELAKAPLEKREEIMAKWAKERAMYEKEIADSKEESERLAEKEYKVSDTAGKLGTLESRKKELADMMKALDAQHELDLEEAKSDKEREEKNKEYYEKRSQYQKEYWENEEKYNEIAEEALKHQLEIAKKFGVMTAAERKQKEADFKKEQAAKAVSDLSELYAKKARGEEVTDEEIAHAESKAKSATKEANMAQLSANLTKALSNALTKALSTALNAIDENIETIKSYQSPIKARLQGYARDYDDILGTLSGNLAVSPYVSYKTTLENLSKLVEAGIAYNVEERAFLATITDKIATTFDAFDANLLRIIRLQQADTTASRMAMEAALTRFFNSRFSDSSYLTDVYDTVQGAILDASSQLSYKDSTAFEYVLQKWLGSLYSLGLSSAAVSNIAGGINMLATGNVQGLSGNTQMQTLLAMAASRSGDVDYASALTEGLNASQLNSLMKSMVEYLREIAYNSDNQVVRAAYGDIFNFTLSDLSAIQHVTNEDIKTISQSMMSYDDSMKELYNQFSQVSSRMSLAEQISNAFQNAAFASAENIANNAALYPLWLVTNMITSATGGIPLPNIGIMGNFLDLTAFHIEDFVKLGIVGLGSLGMIGDIISSLSNGGGISGDIFSTWNATQTTSRGSAPDFFSGVGTGVSTSAEFVGTGSSGDYKSTSLQQGKEEADENKEITMPGSDEDKTFNDLYKALFEEGEQQEILVRNKNFDKFAEALLPGVTKDSVVSPLFNSEVSSIFDLMFNGEGEAQAINVNVVGGSIVATNEKEKSDSVAASITAEELSSLLSITVGENKYTIADLIKKVMEDNLNVEIQNENIKTFFETNSMARIETFGGVI